MPSRNRHDGPAKTPLARDAANLPETVAAGVESDFIVLPNCSQYRAILEGDNGIVAEGTRCEASERNSPPAPRGFAAWVPVQAPVSGFLDMDATGRAGSKPALFRFSCPAHDEAPRIPSACSRAGSENRLARALLLSSRKRRYHDGMTLGLTALRPARTQDADALAAIHEETWRATYRGVIDGVELERMISRRGPKWWRTALSRGVRILVLHVAGVPAGYATFGRSRMRELPFEGEIYELYVRPDHQGMGFGTELFHAARAALEKSRLSGLALRVLRDNEDAVRFYHHRGGQALMTTRERVAQTALHLTVFGWFPDDPS